MGEVAAPSPRPCVLCRRTKGFWRYPDRPRWHCVACAPPLDADAVTFDWDDHSAPLVARSREPGEEG